MKERPILFSAPMIRALLDGSKTQTRRIVKPQPMGELRPLSEWSAGLAAACHDHNPDADKLKAHSERLKGRIFPFTTESGSLMSPSCPYGLPGDRLWVKETHLYAGPGSGSDLPDYVAEARNPVNHKPENCWYRADGDDATVIWKPSIHMFRGLSRITLEVTNVRVERLQDISEEDARAEGIEKTCGMWRDYHSSSHAQIKAIDSYRTLWESINGPGSWAANPWVWVLSFKQAQP